jgi:hypothetical protein
MTQAVALAQQASTGVSQGFKNRIINGAMTISQRNGSGSVNQSTSVEYTLDRWLMYGTVATKFSVQQDAGAVTPPAGFNDYLGVTSLSAYSVGTDDIFSVQQPIEGFNVADLNWGSANAKTVTLSFWVRSSLTGTFGGALNNTDASRSYPYSYTISSANTWEYKTVTVAGDTTGTWLTTNGIGIRVTFGLGQGSTYSGTAGTWVAGGVFNVTGATSVVGTNGATFYITGVQLEVGSTATSFDYRPYTTELGLCYRYCYALYKEDNIVYGLGYYFTASEVRTVIQMPVTMRTAPTISYSGYTTFYRNGTNDANNINSWTISYSTKNTAQMISGNSMSGTAGQSGNLYAAGGGQLIFLAEL